MNEKVVRSRSRNLRLFAVVLIAALGVYAVRWRFTSRDSPFARLKVRNTLSVSTRKILDSADQFELLSLNPTSIEYLKPEESRPAEIFHDFPVLGRIKIIDQNEKKALLEALYLGIAKSDGSVASCFNPRHGIRAKLGTEIVDLVICFECHQIETDATNGKSVLTDSSAQPVFDQMLTDAGVPLPKVSN